MQRKLTDSAARELLWRGFLFNSTAKILLSPSPFLNLVGLFPSFLLSFVQLMVSYSVELGI